MKKDCTSFVRRCDKCQRFAEVPRRHPEPLHFSEASWPFHRWGIDLLGPFPLAPGQLKYLVVAVDYFTKWVEAEPLATITAEKIRKFVWRNIICRFGLPREIVSDNGTQFTDKRLRELCDNFQIRQIFTSVEHPQTNGLAEAANKIVLTGLKKKLDQAKGHWAEELPEILWGYHTTAQSSTQETPYRLVFGSEAMIPVEVAQPSLRRITFNEEADLQTRMAELDLIEEDRELAQIREQATKQRVARTYHRKLDPRTFQVGDLVLRKIEPQRKPPGEGKLAPNWEGPFRVTQDIGKGAYKIAELPGQELPRTWNAASLRKYYS